MKIEVDINKKFLFIIAGILFLAWVFVFAGAFGGTNPSTIGHTTGEIDWNTEINSIKVKELTYTGDSFKISKAGVSRIIVDDSSNKVIVGSGRSTVLESTGNILVGGDLFAKPEGSFCISSDTGISGDSFTGKTSLSLLINERNICEDINGCTYRWLKYKSASSTLEQAGINFDTDSPVYYRQISSGTSGKWFTANGDKRGTNGDNIEDAISNAITGGSIFDDDNGFGQPNSKEDWVIEDNTNSESFIVTVCDF